ncbi:hypothetical protein [Amnibacterium setariae]|uniref:Uncharacterized protein n=1 Tax=Amnibacterium setariae TaxID=2306585 RepID=A0A3A1TT69_9MICO|nr:hypothetical protein [Amnibacterium setariae]RIX26472.1 hypothetical protein D1781_16180 [Amnibacterium setariae]
MIPVVEQHHCSKRHRNSTYFARCAWPGASVTGRGQLAIVITCPDARVVLVERLRWAHTLLAEFNVFGCGPGCEGAHEIVAIDLDPDLPPFPAQRSPNPEERPR